MDQQLLIVILNYLATNVTVDCLKSLSSCDIVNSGKAKVIVWENGTGDEAVSTLRETIESNQWEQWVELLISSKNLGFTGGNNRVIERAMQSGDEPDYFLLLNSDTLVTNEALTSLINFMDCHPKAGIAGSKLLTETGENQCSPFRFPGISSEFDQGLKLGMVSHLLSRWCVSMPPPQHETQVDWVSGASMILRRQMLDQIGLLDEGFFTYFEDMDFCQRAHYAGWEVWYVPQSRVIHLEGASSGIVRHIVKRRPRFWFQARRRYFLKHEGRFRAACIDAAYVVGFSFWRLRRLLQNKPDIDPPQMLPDFIRNSVIFAGFKLPTVQAPSLLQSNKKSTDSRKFDIFYVEGPGDVVEAFNRWNNQDDVLSETARTYSSQFFEFCQTNNLVAYVLSYHSVPKQTDSDQFLVENRPKPLLGGGAGYHLSQILYGLRIVATAIRYRPRFVDVTSGVTYWFVLAPLGLFGIKVVAHLHNSFWPIGHPPAGFVQRVLLAMDGWFFRHIAFAALCVSPEIERQINTLTGKEHCPIYQFRGQFYRRDFENSPPPPSHGQKPFRVVFAGRIERNKGVFDLLDVADQLRYQGVEFDLCGGGPALEELKVETLRRKLNDVVHIHGQLRRPELLDLYIRGHVVIVPTRSDCAEAFAKVAAEAILLGRPAICSSVVPAVEILQEATIEVTADCVNEYVAAIQGLVMYSGKYALLCNNCRSLREQFLDGRLGLTSVLQKGLLGVGVEEKEK